MPERERYLTELTREAERRVFALELEVSECLENEWPFLGALRRLDDAQRAADRYRFSLTAVERAA